MSEAHLALMDIEITRARTPDRTEVYRSLLRRDALVHFLLLEDGDDMTVHHIGFMKENQELAP